MKKLNILMAQINPMIGAINANADHIINVIKNHQTSHDLIVFPELVLTGYPPEDLLLRASFHQQIAEALTKISAVVEDCHVLVGHPYITNAQCFNSATVFYQGNRLAIYHKQKLPNYAVFDEARYFTPGEKEPCVLTVDGYRFGIAICEDIWNNEPIDQLIQAGVKNLICLNASPFHYNKYQERETLLQGLAHRGFSVIYINQVGGQDELVFDGQSLAVDSNGKICARAKAFREDLSTVQIDNNIMSGKIEPLLTKNESIYQALVFGLRDYVEKNGFPGVLIGLSGGIDSALTLAIAVDALGASRVHAVMMPSRYTAEMSVSDAQEQINTLGVSSNLLSIEPAYNAFLSTLAPAFEGYKTDTTEENLQARIRGTLLMALSNKTGKMVLTTSNKSETAVGYATLYGDMAGGFSVLKDLLKTQVYTLARYRNSVSAIIPERVLTRAPSAELAENQTDQDSLPNYDILDSIIIDYMENNLPASEIIDKGFKSDEVIKVIKLIQRNEYKRRQAAPGVKISPRAFGRDWRMPITSGFVD